VVASWHGGSGFEHSSILPLPSDVCCWCFSFPQVRPPTGPQDRGFTVGGGPTNSLRRGSGNGGGEILRPTMKT